MRRVAVLFFLILLAQSVDKDRSSVATPGTPGMHVDRHIDAHVPTREGTPAASPSDGVSREPAPPAPARESGAFREPPPPPVYSPRDPLHRDWR